MNLKNGLKLAKEDKTMANKPKTNATAKGKDYFRVRVRIGDDMKGNPIYKNFYGTSKSDAEKET